MKLEITTMEIFLGQNDSLLCVNMGCHIVKFQLRDFNSLCRQTSANVEDLGIEYTGPSKV